MKLTKGKISKLYHKKKQSVKKRKYQKGKTSTKSKTFRGKKKINLANKSLKRFAYKKYKGGDEEVKKEENELSKSEGDELTNQDKDEIKDEIIDELKRENLLEEVKKEAIEEIKSRHLSAEDEKKAIDEVNNQDLTEESIENELIEQLDNNDKLYEDANTTTNKKTMKEKVGSIKKKVFTPENKKKNGK